VVGAHQRQAEHGDVNGAVTERQVRDYLTEENKRLVQERQCIPDFIQPEEMADVILFLASDLSACVTGQEILADRGWAHS